MKRIITYFKHLFCNHKYNLVVNVELQEWKEESMKLLLDGKISSFTTTNTLTCYKCGHTKYYITTDHNL